MRKNNFNYTLHLVLGSFIILTSIVSMLFIFGVTFGTVFYLAVGALILIWGLLKKISKIDKYQRLVLKFQKVFLVLFIIWLISFLTIQIFILSSTKDTTDKNVDFAVVLGAGLRDGKPSGTLAFRLLEAVEYFNTNPETIIIVSGGIGTGQEVSEAKVMKNFLIQNGVDKQNIVKETSATNTMENIKFSKKIMQDIGKKSPEIVIITSDFHLSRAKFLAKRQGLKPYGIAANTPISVRVNYFIREYFAVIKSFIFDY